MIDRFRRILRTQPEKSDIFLCLGTVSLFSGSFLIYPPAAFLVIGAVFIWLAIETRPSIESAN